MRSAADAAPSYVFVPGLAAAGDEIAFGGEEAHYLRRVVRVRAGERVTATDGEGLVADLRVLEAGEACRAAVVARRVEPRAATLELWCGAPEGDRADWLVEKLAELGVAVLRLVDAERASWERAARRAERWERLAVAALRQSRSAYRLRVIPPAALEGALAAAGSPAPGWLADPAGEPLRAGLAGAGAHGRAAVGPSGGFSDAERKQLEDNGFIPTRLTGTRLRTETAALAIASLLLAGPGAG